MWRGGCQCGACSFVIQAERLVVYACHCRECGRQSASAFGLSAPVPAADFQAKGPTRTWARPTDSGTTTDCVFCAECGSRLYHVSRRDPSWVTVKGGAIEGAGEIEPAGHLWVSRKAAWIRIPEDTPSFETQPDDLAAWRRGLVAGD
jgi:hypothetical protein